MRTRGWLECMIAESFFYSLVMRPTSIIDIPYITYMLYMICGKYMNIVE